MNVLDYTDAEVVLDTSTATRAEWLAARRNGIGGSDVAAIAGLNRWRTPLAVYLDKIGALGDDDEPSEAMEWGTILEAPIAEAVAARHGLDLEPVRAMLSYPREPHMLANLDRAVVGDRKAYYAGRVTAMPPGVYEGKTTGVYTDDARKWRAGIVPDAAALQTHHYLAVTGWPYAYVAVLIGGQRLEVVRIERDEELVAMLVKLEAEFWRRVEDRDPPPPMPADDDLLGDVWEANADEIVELGPEYVELVERRREAAADEKAAKDRKAVIDAELKLALGEATVGLGPDGAPLVTWREVPEAQVEAFTRDAYRRIHYPKPKARK